MSELAAISTESLDAQISSAAYHEAGHEVIAAALGLRLRAEGIMVGQDAQGLACYCKEPDGTDASVEANVIASFAGCYAENYFRNLQGYQPRDYSTVMWSLDWKEARGLEGLLSNGYLADRNVATVHKCLEERAEQLVVQHWQTIEGLAEALLSKGVGAEEGFQKRHSVERSGESEIRFRGRDSRNPWPLWYYSTVRTGMLRRDTGGQTGRSLILTSNEGGRFRVACSPIRPAPNSLQFLVPVVFLV